MMEDYELCKQLYELTGWEHIRPSATTNRWYSQNGSIVMNRSEKGNAIVPVYSTDYLLTNLPKQIMYVGGTPAAVWWNQKLGKWQTGFDRHVQGSDNRKSYYFIADTPKTAILKLAIELAKAGVIGKEGE